MRFSWTRERGMVALSAAIMALCGAQAALAQQFVPYSPTPVQGYEQYQAYTPSAYLPHQAAPQYTAMAPQGNNVPVNTQVMSQGIETIMPGAVNNPGTVVHSAPVQGYSSAPMSAGCNCQGNNSGYVSGGFAAGACGSYNTFDNNCGCSYGIGAPYGGCDTSCGMGGAYDCGNAYGGGRGCGRQWFGGFYGLYMQRAGSDWVPLAFSTPTGNAPPYYPADTEYVMNLQGFTETEHVGAEVRLGATFGGRRGCGCDCGPRHAWEVAYWGLVEEDESAVVTDLTTDANRLYGMIDYRGLEYDPGTGYRPVNDYYDYGPPTVDRSAPGPDIEVRSFVARSTFSAQNIELNFLCLPVLTDNCGGCDTGCYGGGCGIGGRRGRCGSRYSVTTLVGARYLRLDEDFMFRTNYENTGTAALGFISHNVAADNHLVGVNLGCNGVYHCGCSGRWALHCNANAGLFGNHMEVSQRMDVPVGGTVRYANGTNANFAIDTEDDDIAMLAELRAGLSYQYSCNWRFYGGYRALGVSGIALGYDQIPSAYITPAQTGYVISDGSIFLHGLQAGIECTY